MKKVIKYSIAVCILITCSWACNDNKTANGSSISMRAISDSISSKKLDSVSYQIENDSAQKYISEYVKYINLVKGQLSRSSDKFPDNSQKLNYGVKVDLQELKQVLANSSPGAELYLMMGVMESDSAEVIFSLKSNPIAENTLDTLFWRFFDFTQPCPAACPKLSDIKFNYTDL